METRTRGNPLGALALWHALAVGALLILLALVAFRFAPERCAGALLCPSSTGDALTMLVTIVGVPLAGGAVVASVLVLVLLEAVRSSATAFGRGTIAAWIGWALALLVAAALVPGAL